ncbi:MAG: ATP-binding protein [Candidatus Micrarchaeota archaeon]
MQQKAATDGRKADKRFFFDTLPAEGTMGGSQIRLDARIKRSGWAVAQDIGSIIANSGRPDNRTDARLKRLLVEYENSDASVKDKIALLEKAVRYGGRKENRKLLASSAKKSEEALVGQIRFLSQKDGSTSSEEKMKILDNISPDVAGKKKVAAAIKKSRAEQEAYLKEQAPMQEVRNKEGRISGFYALFGNELDADEYGVVLQSRMQPALYSGLIGELDGLEKGGSKIFKAETDATYADTQGQWRNVPAGFSQFSPKNVSGALAKLEGPEEMAKYLDSLLQKLAEREPALRGSRAEGYLTGQRDWEADSPDEVRRNMGAWLLGVGISSKQVASQTPDADIRRTLAGVGRDAGLLEEAVRTNWGNVEPEEFVSQAGSIFDKYGKAMENERWRTYEPTFFGLYSESPITNRFWAPVSRFVERYSGELEMAGLGVVSLVQPGVGAALFFGMGAHQIDQAMKNGSAGQAIMGALMCVPGAGRVVATLGAESKAMGAAVRLADIGASAGMTGTMSYEIWKTVLRAGSSYWSLADVMKIGADAGMMIGLPLASKTFGGGKKRNMVEKTNGLQMDGNRPLEKGNETNTTSSSIGTGHEAKDGQTLTPEEQKRSIESRRRRIHYLEKTIDECNGLVRERMDIRGNSDAGKLRLKEIEEKMNNITAAYARFFKKGLTTLESLDALHEEWTTDASKYKNIRRYSTKDAGGYVKNYQGNRSKVRGVAYRGSLNKTDVTTTDGFTKAMRLMEKEYEGTPQGKFLQENPPMVLGANVLFPLILARMGEYYPTTDIILVERAGMPKARARSVSVLIHETHHYLGSLGKDGAFNEGYTQLLTEAILEKNGVKSSRVYGSAVEGAYYLEQIVGQDVMNDAYFNGNHARLKAALDEKLGDGTYDRCMSFSYGLLGTVKFRRYVKKAIKKANLGGKEIKVSKWDKKTSWKEREKTQPDRMVEKFETPVATDQTKPDSKTGQASGMDAKAELDKKASIDKIQEIYEKKFGRPFELPKSVAWEKFDVIDADCVEKIIRGSKRAGCAFSVSEYLRIINSPSFSPEYRDLVGVILSNFKKDGDVSIGNGLVKLRNHMEAGRSFGENLQNIRDAPEEFRKKYPHYNRGLADLIINACAMDALEFERPGAVEFLHKNNGIEFFGRYSLETLINQYDNYGKRNPLKPLMVIINPLRDWNGAFYGDIKNIEGLCENMDARIVEVGSAKDAKNEIAKTAGLYGDLISSVWVSGHSTKRTMQLGNAISGLVSGVGIAYGGDLSKYFIPHPSVIVVGCKSGADVIGGMARSASGRYKNALFYAPSSTDAGHIIEYAGTDPAGTPLFDVKWTSEFSNIYEGGKVIAQPNINDRIEERKVAKQTGENAALKNIEELGNTASEEMAEMLKVGIMHNAKNLAITPRNLAEIILMDINQESSPPALVENLKLVSKSGGEMGRLFDELAKSKKPPQTGPGSESVQMPREPAQIIADMEKNIETTRAALDKVIPLLENQQGGQEMDEFIDLFKFAQDGLDIALSEMEGSTQIRLNNIALTIYDACANSTKNRRISMDVQYYKTTDGSALEPIRLQDESVFANYNPLMVRAIIENLVSNAERYGSSAGKIEVVIGPSDVKIRMSDDGPGLSAGMAAHAFDYNTKLENRKEGSTGVGLWYCKWAAEQMGGTIGFTDLGPAYGGKMTTIEVSLPIAKME